jgi:hypothetical protein
MNELRPLLDRARREAPPAAPDLERLHRRREHKERAGHVLTATLALLVGFAAIGGAWFAFRGASDARSGSGGTIGAPTINLHVPDGAYYYIRTHADPAVMAVNADANLDPRNEATYASNEATWETWWATDDSGRIRNLQGSYFHDGTFGAGGFSSDSGQVSDLSSDPVELERQLRIRVDPGGASPEPYDDWGGPVEWGLIRSIRELLDAPDVAPDVKAALLQVAVGLEGVGAQLDLQAKDPVGRAAILLTTETEGATHEWWFDPYSHQLLAARDMRDGSSESAEIVEGAGIGASTGTAHLDREFVPGVPGA